MNDIREQDILDALDQHWAGYRTRFKAGRRAVSEKSIHDLRVAARRFQALLDTLRPLDPHFRVKKIRRFLAQQLDQLNEVRDAHVMVREVDQSMETMPQLRPFRDYLQAYSDELTRAARRNIRKSRPSDLQKRVQGTRKVAKKHFADNRLVERLLQVVDEAYAKTMEALGKLNQADPAGIHRTRIAFKKFRYMVEVVQPFLSDYPKSYPEKMHAYQEAMGSVRDTTLLLSKLKDFEQEIEQGGRGQAPSFDPTPVKQYYQDHLNELIRVYYERKDELKSFWRAAPGQPFPWEKSHEPVHRTARNRRATRRQQQRGAGQPATAHRSRPKKVPDDRPSPKATGDPDQPDRNQSVPAGG